MMKRRMKLSLAQYLLLRHRPEDASTTSLMIVVKACTQAAREAKAAKEMNPVKFYWSGRVLSYALTRRNQILGWSFTPNDAVWTWRY